MSELLDRVRARIEALEMNFQFVGTIKTSMNGIERETWLMEYENSQFVFVAGQKNVVLGWDVNTCSVGSKVMEGLREEFTLGHEYYQDEIANIKDYYQKKIEDAGDDFAKTEKLCSELAMELENFEEEMNESGYANWEDFMAKWNENLSQCLSPLRTADIGDMIVEVDSRYLEEDAPSLEQAVCSLKKGPFTLATEDEWEYLCNGGAHTLFRWGDTLDEVMSEIYNVGAVSNVKEKNILEQNNMLGLFIAYNSYKNEIIDNTMYTKGGDGGCSLCGGDGAIYVLPCYTAFYRYPVHTHSAYKHQLSKHYFCYRRIIRLR